MKKKKIIISLAVVLIPKSLWRKAMKIDAQEQTS